MSYIRNTSNPEGLYIWDDGVMINIYWSGDNQVKVDRDSFFKLLDEYSEYNDTPIIVDNITLSHDDNFKVTLKFNSENINFPKLTLWLVTWESIISEHRRRKFWFSKWNRLKFLFNKLNW